MDGNGLVSVIVPVYNTGMYLRRCIESIIRQNYEKIELLLIDDGSTDDSLEICYRYMDMDNRIKVIHQENGGVCSARNRGINEMHGDYFMFVDSDDAIETNIIASAIEFFSKYPCVDMVVFGWKKIFENGQIESYMPIKECISDMESAVKTLLEHYNGYGGGYPNKLWKTSSFDMYIPRYNESLFYFEDMEWMTRMFLGIKSFACLDQNGYLYYIRGNSTTFRQDNTERKEYGYHLSALQIVEDLVVSANLQRWYQDRYYPEIVNGVIHAWKYRYRNLNKWLLGIMQEISEVIMKSSQISFKIKIRCIVLLIFKYFVRREEYNAKY